jgi:O-antigen/teichoic acid export membrane protein
MASPMRATARGLAKLMATAPELTPTPELAVGAPSIRWGFAWTLLGNSVYALCQWSVLSLIAKLGNPAMVGQYALALAVTAPVFMLTNLQLRAVQVTDAIGKYCDRDFAVLRSVASLAAMVTVLGFVVFSGWERETRAVLLLVAAGKAVEGFGDITSGVMQRAERLDRVAISLLWRGGLTLATFWFLSSRTHSNVAGFTGALLASFLVFCAYDVPFASRLVRHAKTGASVRRVTELFRVSLPLGCVMALVSLNINIPRYMLDRYAGRAELGIFASLSYVVLAVSLLVTALGQSVSVRLSLFYAEREFKKFKKLVVELCAFAALIGVIGAPAAALCGRWLLSALYRPEYAEHVNVFVLLVVGAGFTAVGSFLGYALTAAHVFKPQLWTMLATCGTTALCSYLLVPRLGLSGAALAVLASSVVFAAGCAWLLRCALRDRRQRA